MMFTYISAFLLHQVSYFFIYSTFLIADYIPFLHKYKIQKDIVNDISYTSKAYKKVIISHFTMELPMMLIFYKLTEILNFSYNVPNPYHVIYVCIISLFIEDFYFYLVHRLLHHHMLYKHIHKIHHEYTAPFGFAAEYAHPLETIMLGFGTVIGPLLLTTNYYTVLCWLVLRIYQTVEAHSGYDFRIYYI
ncbi:Fatty acid hydroxylase (C-4 methyl sterol oxidase putative) [Orpheovirus IHUMI-LCC2]|uniref:Fatty acid hydroxylase (C-4 methyl sterol oxidase putative) n=1 Tax=Orpheovirus IHUMI-LCC2 TaxID=2023057 RepID=A0A2I2L4P4_9VIRU|nr:Fatty acid hydroxylase (C-4 methyl sterol oxidase putative) [Orpheovirus IHUMI-LCC2]SNW62494.1 Fatty acid hydroxylase (C-4 methyl sterol oxidase putative) [Orpheovirus IHUMI-LCC2]